MKNIFLTIALLLLSGSVAFANCDCSGDKEKEPVEQAEPVAQDNPVEQAEPVEPAEPVQEPSRDIQEIDEEEFVKFAAALKAEAEEVTTPAVPSSEEPSKKA